MKRKFAIAFASLLSLGLAGAGKAAAQQQNQEAVYRLANNIRKQILTLSNYGVFDYITFGIDPGAGGYKVVLKGYASRPTLKDSAERVVKKLEQVEVVENQIEVLPVSRQDEDIRMRTYAAIYYHPTLSRYNPNRGTPVYGSAAGFQRARTMGISNDPPMGYHPISIIAKGGNVTLEGVVDNDMDKQIAGMQANTVNGVFSVTNNLQAMQPSKKKDEKK
jgi:osmotically-inducible protein OsmY